MIFKCGNPSWGNHHFRPCWGYGDNVHTTVWGDCKLLQVLLHFHAESSEVFVFRVASFTCNESLRHYLAELLNGLQHCCLEIVEYRCLVEMVCQHLLSLLCKLNALVSAIAGYVDTSELVQFFLVQVKQRNSTLPLVPCKIAVGKQMSCCGNEVPKFVQVTVPCCSTWYSIQKAIAER